MANHEIVSPKVFSPELRKIEENDPVHCDISNPLFKTLINNDAYLKDYVENVIEQDIKSANLDIKRNNKINVREKLSYERNSLTLNPLSTLNYSGDDKCIVPKNSLCVIPQGEKEPNLSSDFELLGNIICTKISKDDIYMKFI